MPDIIEMAEFPKGVMDFLITGDWSDLIGTVNGPQDH